MNATREVAVALCFAVEAIAKNHSCHVALTGGCLYKAGERKDIDLLFYRVRQVAAIPMPALFDELETIGLVARDRSQFGRWCVKCDWQGLSVDCFFPDGTAVPAEGEDYT